LGLIYPTSGHAEIFGKDCIGNGAEIRHEIGYLPGEVFCYDNMTVGEMLRYSASFYKKDSTARIRELSERMELDLKRRIDELSFGNRKKVGIVQGILHSPKLLLLDEPTAGLDPIMQQTFFDILREENERGASILFSSHILSEVQRLCDRVGIIKEGRLIKVEHIQTLRENTFRKVKAEGRNLREEDFRLDGVSGLAMHKNSAEFLFGGKIGVLLETLSRFDLDNLWIEEPNLEEVFLNYYRDGE